MKELIKEARKYKNVEEFGRYLVSGHSFAEVQNRFRTITGEGEYMGSKIGIKGGEAQGKSFARMPSEQEITDFYTQANVKTL